MPNPIINQAFQVGERYLGQADGKTYTVKEVIKKGTVIQSAYGGRWAMEYDMVKFFCEEDQKPCKVSLQTAQRLLLTKVRDAGCGL